MVRPFGFALSSAGRRVLVDPFFTGNPTFEAQGEGSFDANSPLRLPAPPTSSSRMANGDHIGDSLAIARETGATLFCNWTSANG